MMYVSWSAFESVFLRGECARHVPKAVFLQLLENVLLPYEETSVQSTLFDSLEVVKRNNVMTLQLSQGPDTACITGFGEFFKSNALNCPLNATNGAVNSCHVNWNSFKFHPKTVSVQAKIYVEMHNIANALNAYHTRNESVYYCSCDGNRKCQVNFAMLTMQMQ